MSVIREGRVRTVSIPAPIGGWNARDMLSKMKADEAWVLDNFIPEELGVRQRRGNSEHATGITGNFVESLIPYDAPGESAKMFAAGPQNIFDVSSAGAVGAAAVTSLTNGRFQHVMFPTPGGNYLVICNGEDAVRNYNGTVWSTPTINNVSSSSLINVTAHMSRLWFIERASTSVWYLDTESIAGDATEINLGPLFKEGGQLVAMGSWSRDGGAGPDDHAVFITSKGEVAIFRGTDPDTAPDTWELVGRFKGPEPIGYRCLIKLGANLCVLTSQGVMPMPQYLGESSAGMARMAVTDNISGAFKTAFLATGTRFGWQVLEYPKENLLICNIPIRERAEQHQYVMNLRTGKWCRFKNLNAGCWGVKGDALYFGGNDGIVYAYGGTGIYDDNGEPVSALACQAFNDYGVIQKKNFKSARALITGPAGYVPQIKLLMDYKHDSLPSFSPQSFTELGPEWDLAEWDVAEWGTSQEVTSQWRPTSGAGVAASACLASSVTTALIWNQTDIQFEVGRTQ